MSTPISTVFRSSLNFASKALDKPTIDDDTQDLIRSSLTHLSTLQARIAALSLFSPNETLEDISTRDLIYLAAPYVHSEVQTRVKAIGREDRLTGLELCQKHLNMFLSSLEAYEIVPEDERTLYDRKPAAVTNPALRRELKIKQYQKEKDLKSRIEVIRKRRGQKTADTSASDYDLIISLLPDASNDDEEEQDSGTDEILREATLLLLRLFYTQTQSQLQSMDMELELLRSAPPSIPQYFASEETDSQRSRPRDKDDTWKLDRPAANVRDDILDPNGKPLQPFTILPAGTSDRTRLQAKVFTPGHNLPSMSVDEYLEIERQRGKFISGGGPASEVEPTSSEQLAIDSEMDGSAFGREKEEQKRQKDENWAIFTDANPRGAGNTMNRG